jgi:hypothetical protein
LYRRKLQGILQQQRARKRRKALRRLKSFREPPMLVSGVDSTSFIAAEPNTVSKEPHCLLDERGDHRKLLPAQLEEIVSHIKANMKEGETEEDVNVDIEIPPHILRNILDNSRKCYGCRLRQRYHREKEPRGT